MEKNNKFFFKLSRIVMKSINRCSTKYSNLYHNKYLLFFRKLIYLIIGNYSVNGGETGIRTLETVSRLHTFQACAFDHSATSPFFQYFTYFYQSCKTTETRLFIRPFFSIFEINTSPISAVDLT